MYTLALLVSVSMPQFPNPPIVCPRISLALKSASCAENQPLLKMNNIDFISV